MGVETIILICIFGGLVLLVMGLSFLSQSLRSIDYLGNSLNIESYNKNPLIKLGSKYFHWRPKGAVVLSKSKWAEIEKGINAKIAEAKLAGIELGRSQMMQDIHASLNQRKDETKFPTNPYIILGISSNADDALIDKAYNEAKALYDSTQFQRWDSTFVQLAKIRQEQIDKAYDKIVAGVAPTEGNTKSPSGGTF